MSWKICEDCGEEFRIDDNRKTCGSIDVCADCHHKRWNRALIGHALKEAGSDER